MNAEKKSKSKKERENLPHGLKPACFGILLTRAGILILTAAL